MKTIVVLLMLLVTVIAYARNVVVDKVSKQIVRCVPADDINFPLAENQENKDFLDILPQTLSPTNDIQDYKYVDDHTLEYSPQTNTFKIKRDTFKTNLLILKSTSTTRDEKIDALIGITLNKWGYLTETP